MEDILDFEICRCQCHNSTGLTIHHIGPCCITCKYCLKTVTASAHMFHEQKCAERINAALSESIPTHEWLKEKAEAEDRCESVTAGSPSFNIYDMIVENLKTAPELPCRVEEMTEREAKIFAIAAHYCGLLSFLKSDIKPIKD